MKVAAIDPNDVGEDGKIKLFLSPKPKSYNKMTEALSTATPKMKSKAMPKQVASSDKAPAVAVLSPERSVAREFPRGVSIPQLADHGQRIFLSKKISYLVRGHAHEHAKRSRPRERTWFSARRRT